MEYRKDLQGLRAVAVIFVFIYHVNSSWLPGGYIGVDIFFVLSGFLVASIILKQIENDNFNFVSFYFKRIKRIVPAYYLMLTCTAIGAALLLINKDIPVFKNELLHAIAFDSDRVYANMHSYFGVPLRQHPLLHTWTIANEMKFYLFLPVVLFYIPKKNLSKAITAIAIIFFLFGIYQIYIIHNKSWAYFSLPVRIPEFCIGVLITLKGDKLSIVLQKASNLLSSVSLLVLFILAFLLDNKYYKGFISLLPAIATAFLLLWQNSLVNKLISKNPLEYIGNLSYSIYLWHWPVIALIRYTNAGGQFSVWQYTTIILLTILLSWSSFKFIEEKIRKKPMRTFWYSMVPIGILVFTLYIFVIPVNGKFSSIPDEYLRPVFGLASHDANKVEVFGDTTKNSGILLIGNSHALSMKPYFNYLGRKNGFSFRTITSKTYPAIEGINENEVLEKGSYKDFKDTQQLIGFTSKEIYKSKVVVIVMSWWTAILSFIPAIEKIAKAEQGRQIVLVTPFPVVDKNPVQLNRGFVHNKAINQHYKITYRNKKQDLGWLSAKYSNIHFIDLSRNEVFKEAPFYNDTLMYYDKSHINSFGAITLAKNTEMQFMELLNKIHKY